MAQPRAVDGRGTHDGDMLMTATIDDAASHAALGEEYEHEAVPAARRQRLGAVAAIWFGFPMILTNAVFGGIITYNLGFWPALGALVCGNLVLAAYVGALSAIAGRTGLNFAMQARRTFGTRGFAAASGFLATVVVGWYAFQTGLTGATLHDSFGWNTTLLVCIAAVLYTGVTFIGVRALTVIGLIAAPLYVVLGLVAVAIVAQTHDLGAVTQFAGHPGGMGFAGAVTLVIATFADSGTMTADFTRWSRSGREAVLAALTAFPVANLVSQLFGVVVVAAGAAANPAKDGGNFLSLMTGHGALLDALVVAFVFVNLGSVCTHCLYNGAVGWSHLAHSQMRRLTIILGVIGGILAVAGIWSFFLGWLNLLGIFVPPIGAVIVTDQLLLGGIEQPAADVAYRIPAFVAWGAGAAAAMLVHWGVPGPGRGDHRHARRGRGLLCDRQPRTGPRRRRTLRSEPHERAWWTEQIAEWRGDRPRAAQARADRHARRRRAADAPDRRPRRQGSAQHGDDGPRRLPGIRAAWPLHEHRSRNHVPDGRAGGGGVQAGLRRQQHLGLLLDHGA